MAGLAECCLTFRCLREVVFFAFRAVGDSTVVVVM